MTRRQSDVWPTYLELIEQHISTSDWLPERFKTDPALRQEFRRFLAFMSSYAYFDGVHQDPDYPDFWPCYSPVFPVGFNNPDDVYLLTAVQDSGSYRISGVRGTVRILELELGSSAMQAWGRAAWEPADWTGTLAQYEIDSDAHVQPDGQFDVLLSPSRPAGHTGDWWELKPGTLMILVRQRAYDWANEVDARLSIERIDVPALRPRPTAPDLDAKLESAGQIVQNWAWHMTRWFGSLEDAGLTNALTAKDTHGGGIGSQVYAHGIFDIGTDEALIVEFEVPASCKYWMIHVTDELMSSIDQLNRHSSINGFQAHIDGDGRFRAVISASDPGVPNWLDVGERLRGGISARWWAPNPMPEPIVTKVELADLRTHLPSETPFVTSEARDMAVRWRRRAAQMRRRW